MKEKFLSLPENDPDLRYILGKKGDNNLLVICLNPSTANAFEHDGTTRNIEKIAIANGYDGWVLFNLSPERTSKPEFLSLNYSKKTLEENSNLLEALVLKNEFKISNVLLAWGDNVTALWDFPYLKSSAITILDRLKKYDLNYWCIKETTKGHPFHPSQRSLNRYVGPVEDIKLQSFDVEAYLRTLVKG